MPGNHPVLVGGNHPHAAGTRVRGDDVYLGIV